MTQTTGEIVPFVDKFLDSFPEDNRDQMDTQRKNAARRIGETVLLRSDWEGDAEIVRMNAILDSLKVNAPTSDLVAATEAGSEISDKEVALDFYTAIFQRFVSNVDPNSDPNGDEDTIAYNERRTLLGLDVIEQHIVPLDKTQAVRCAESVVNIVSQAYDVSRSYRKYNIYGDGKTVEFYVQARNLQMDLIEKIASDPGAELSDETKEQHLKTAINISTSIVKIPDELRERAAKYALDRLGDKTRPEDALSVIAKLSNLDLLAQGLAIAINDTTALKAAITPLNQEVIELKEVQEETRAKYDKYPRKPKRKSTKEAKQEAWQKVLTANSDFSRARDRFDQARYRYSGVVNEIDRMSIVKLPALTMTNEGQNLLAFLINWKEDEASEEYNAAVNTAFGEFYRTFAQTGKQTGVDKDSLDTAYKFLSSQGLKPEL